MEAAAGSASQGRGWMARRGRTLLARRRGEPIRQRSGNSIALPAGAAPLVAGAFELRQGKVSVRVEPGVTVTAAGKPITAMELPERRSRPAPTCSGSAGSPST